MSYGCHDLVQELIRFIKIEHRKSYRNLFIKETKEKKEQRWNCYRKLCDYGKKIVKKYRNIENFTFNIPIKC